MGNETMLEWDKEADVFVRDNEPQPIPERNMGIRAALSAEMEKLDVGCSGYVTAKLSTVRTLIARHCRGKRSADASYSKSFVAREIPGGKVRVWRVS